MPKWVPKEMQQAQQAAIWSQRAVTHGHRKQYDLCELALDVCWAYLDPECGPDDVAIAMKEYRENADQPQRRPLQESPPKLSKSRAHRYERRTTRDKDDPMRPPWSGSRL